jgi:chromosome partitioning protein
MLTNELIIEFFNVNKALTIKTIAQESGISPSMLQQVIKGEKRLSHESLDRLLPVLQKYGYKAPASACKVFAVVNQKGGVAKTTSTSFIGAALHKLGKRVLLVDFDPQMSLSVCFGLKDNEKENIYRALKDNSAPPVVSIKEGFDIIPSDIDLAEGEMEFYSDKYNLKLRDMLNRLKPYYDYMLIDTGPSLGSLMMASLRASDRVLIPIQPEMLSVRGLNLLLGTVQSVSRSGNPDLRIQGIFFTQVNKRLVMHKHLMERIREDFSHFTVYEQSIPENTSIKEAQFEEMDIFDFSPNSTGAKGYMQLAKEILGIAKKQKEEVVYG